MPAEQYAQLTPVAQLEVTEGAALGVALLGAHGAGIHPSEDAINAVIENQTREGLMFEPDARRAEQYAERGAIYADIYPSTRGMTHRIFDLVARGG